MLKRVHFPTSVLPYLRVAPQIIITLVFFFWPASRALYQSLLPLSRTNIAALFVILFIYGWNQCFWPLLITTDQSMTTIVMSIKQMLEAAEQSPQWNIIMMTALLAMMPPIVVVVDMQRLFVQGLTETDK